MSIYHRGNRDLQDQFDTRRLADRLEDLLVSDTISPSDAAFISEVDHFFLSTVSPDGVPTVGYKGGAPGFVRVRGRAHTGISQLQRQRHVHGHGQCPRERQGRVVVHQLVERTPPPAYTESHPSIEMTRCSPSIPRHSSSCASKRLPSGPTAPAMSIGWNQRNARPSFRRTVSAHPCPPGRSPTGRQTYCPRATRRWTPMRQSSDAAPSMVDRWRRSSRSKSPSTAQNLSALLTSGARRWAT